MRNIILSERVSNFVKMRTFMADDSESTMFRNEEIQIQKAFCEDPRKKSFYGTLQDIGALASYYVTSSGVAFEKSKPQNNEEMECYNIVGNIIDEAILEGKAFLYEDVLVSFYLYICENVYYLHGRLAINQTEYVDGEKKEHPLMLFPKYLSIEKIA